MSELTFTPNDSKSIGKVTYQLTTGLMSVMFKSGGTCHFEKVPVSHFHGMQDAPSVGKYYQEHILDKHKAVKS